MNLSAKQSEQSEVSALSAQCSSVATLHSLVSVTIILTSFVPTPRVRQFSAPETVLEMFSVA